MLRALVALNVVWALLAELPAWAVAIIVLAAAAAGADLVRLLLRAPRARRAEEANVAAARRAVG